MSETYEQYVSRVSGLPDFIPLTETEWAEQSKPKPDVQPKPAPAPKRTQFTAEDRIHMHELAEVRRRETELLKQPSPEGFAKLGLTAVEHALLQRNDAHERLKDALASDAENQAELARQGKKLEDDVANAEHYREQAAQRLLADRIAERNKKAAQE